MSHLPKVLNALSLTLRYPNENTVGAAELLFVVLHDVIPEAARDASKFGAFVEQHELWEVEEAFTRVFDINPTCSLEIGWHLFGEEYARGMFLVRMREELRKYGLSESVELPDHIAHVLAVVAAMPQEESDRFVGACLQPAVEKMVQALEGKNSPYEHVLSCLAAVLRDTWGDPIPSDDEASHRGSLGQTGKVDLLRDYPVADVNFAPEGGCGSGGCGGGGCGTDASDPEPSNFVPLQMPLSDQTSRFPDHSNSIPGSLGIPGNLGDEPPCHPVADAPISRSLIPQPQAPTRKP